MLRVVLDTNIVVSAALTQSGNPTTIMHMVFDEDIVPCCNTAILAEYTEVLGRSRLGIDPPVRQGILDAIVAAALFVEPVTQSKTLMPDESDRIFYDTAKTVGAILITGNTRHYPPDSFVMTPADFVASMNRGTIKAP